jgi:hypothetical protein
MYLEAHACLPVGVPAAAPAHTSASSASLKRRAILGAARGPVAPATMKLRTRTAPSPGRCLRSRRPSTRMAAATSVTSLVLMNATLSSQACPPGWRLALVGVARDRVREHVRVPGIPLAARRLIVQNAVAHEGGLGPLWKTRRQFWADRETPEAAVRENFSSYAATRQRHVGTSPTTENYDPDLWTDELAFLSRRRPAGHPDRSVVRLHTRTPPR